VHSGKLFALPFKLTLSASGFTLYFPLRPALGGSYRP